ncbi:hypothetical protein V8Z80_05780 [Orrella sp. JC864]|uniref:hypothetical protein n=1 Tax=Orrella sp. JC864 TaxID=3120298 RepID=UPI00300B870D
MKHHTLAALVLACLMLGGCAVHTRDASVVVDPYGIDRGFCPPGQAKKGNC